MRSATTTRRMENVRILLRTLNDVYPGPEGSRPMAESGLAPSRFVKCDACRFNRRVLKGCLVCDGLGYRPRRAGDPDWDSYAQRPIIVEARKTVPVMTAQQREAEIRKAELDLRLRAGELDLEAQEPWERARAARDRDASYAELERVLDELQTNHPLARSFVSSLYFDGLSTFSPLAQRLDDQIVEWIAGRMRGKIKVPHRFYEEQLAERRERCKELLAQGVDELEIAKELGSSRRFVRTIAAGTLQVSFRGPAPVTVSARV